MAQFVAQYAEGAEGAQLAIGGVGIHFAQLGGDPFEELLFGALWIEFAVFLPLLVLGFLDETEHVFRVQRQLAVVTGRCSQLPAVGDHLADDVVLEDLLVGFIGHWIPFLLPSV